MSTCSNTLVPVLIHPSQFPEAVGASMHQSLASREMNHKFHYDTPKQTLRWLRLHEALSPARTDPNCMRIYDSAFADCVHGLQSAREVQVVSLGCGGGQKDAQLLRQFLAEVPGVKLSYVPADVSLGLSLTARAAAIRAGVSASNIQPLVIDLAAAADWASALEPVISPASCRVYCFFGMLPNFLPDSTLPRLTNLVQPSDRLLLSANLAPGEDYAKGVAKVLPLYDNTLTRDWLWSVLADLGFEQGDARMDFHIRDAPGRGGLLWIEATVTFLRDCRVEYGGTIYSYAQGDLFRLFFSCRHTAGKLRETLSPYGLEVESQWVNASGEEGVFSCVRRPDTAA